MTKDDEILIRKMIEEVLPSSLKKPFWCSTSARVKRQPFNGDYEADVNVSSGIGTLNAITRLVLALGIVIFLVIIGCNVKQCTVGALNEDLDKSRKEVVSLCEETARLGEAIKALDGGISRLDGNVRQLSDEASDINNKFGCVRQLHSMLASISNNVSEAKATVQRQCCFCGWCLDLKTDKSNDR